MTTPARSRDQKSAPIDDQSSAPTLPEGLRARRGSAAAWGSSGQIGGTIGGRIARADQKHSWTDRLSAEPVLRRVRHRRSSGPSC
jgi:hypothetical protein